MAQEVTQRHGNRQPTAAVSKQAKLRRRVRVQDGVRQGPPGKGNFWVGQTWACPVGLQMAWIFGATMRRFIELLRSLVIIFGIQYTELMCNMTVIYSINSPTYCCYTTLGNIGCIYSILRVCGVCSKGIIQMWRTNEHSSRSIEGQDHRSRVRVNVRLMRSG